MLGVGEAEIGDAAVFRCKVEREFRLWSWRSLLHSSMLDGCCGVGVGVGDLRDFLGAENRISEAVHSLLLLRWKM